VECEWWSREGGVWSVNGGVGRESVECEWWSREGRVWSVNGGVGRVECGV